MELVVLGAQGWPGPDGAASGYLLLHEGAALVLDLGNGTLAQLQKHLQLDEVSAFCITHAHPDHFVDLYSVWVAAAFGEQAPDGIELHAPPGFLDTLSALLSHDSRPLLSDTFHFVPAHDGDRFQVGPFEIQAVGVEHPLGAVGFRVEAEGAVFAYSGDTGPTDKLSELAQDANVFLCEATYQGEAPAEYPYHLSGAQAGAYAAAAQVGTLVLTHQWPSLDPAVTRAQAAAAFDGRIEVATMGMKLEVG